MFLIDFIESISHSLIYFNSIPQQVRNKGRLPAILHENSDSNNESEPSTICKMLFDQCS